MIKSFRDAKTERVWKEEPARRIPPNILGAALKKLQMLNAATALRDLMAPPGNRLEPLHGDGQGQHSIRINDPYRVCFQWRDGHAYMVEITDDH